MIAYLEGSILHIRDAYGVVLAGAVGYQVALGARVAASLRIGDHVRLWIETVSHEGQVHLFGFQDEDDHTWFRWLTLVQGVGGRVAQGVLSSLPAGRLAQALAQKDEASLRLAEGVGPKLAARLCTELAAKAQSWTDERALALTRASGQEGVASPGSVGGVSGVDSDALLALMALGYKRSSAQQALEAAWKRGNADLHPAGELGSLDAVSHRWDSAEWVRRALTELVAGIL